MNSITTTEKDDTLHFSQEQVDLIKKTIMPEASDQELQLFGMVCNRLNLDPFARQINAIKRANKWSFEPTIDGFRSIAESTGKYGGSQTFWCDADGIWVDVWLKKTNPVAAKTVIYRTDSENPFVGVARFESYKVAYNGKLSNFWSKMPDLMIGKVSEALALRKAFPRNLSGVYTSEEMGQSDNFASRMTREQGQRIKSLRESLEWSKEKLIDLSQEQFNKPPQQLSQKEATALTKILEKKGTQHIIQVFDGDLIETL